MMTIYDGRREPDIEHHALDLGRPELRPILRRYVSVSPGSDPAPEDPAPASDLEDRGESEPSSSEGFATWPLIGVHEDVTLDRVAEVMVNRSIGAVGVFDGGQDFRGLFTERDLVATLSMGKDPFHTRVATVVNDFPVVVDPGLTRTEAIGRMLRAHVRHLLVRSADGGYRIVSMRDLLRSDAGGAAAR